MDINRFTERAQQGLSAAQTKAVRYGHQQIDVEHLLTALLEQERGLATAIFTKADVQTESLKQRLEQELERLPKVGGPSGAPTIRSTSPAGSTVCWPRPKTRRGKFNDEFISVEHLLLAMTDDTGATGRLFREFGVTRERLMRALQEVRGSQRVTSQNPEATYEALERYGRDLTKLATTGQARSGHRP